MLYEFEREREDPRFNLISSSTLQFPLIIPPLNLNFRIIQLGPHAVRVREGEGGPDPGTEPDRDDRDGDRDVEEERKRIFLDGGRGENRHGTS